MLDADLSFSYGDGRSVFNGFRFAVGEGEKLLVVAPPGSGKTTLAKILTGALPGYSGGELKGHAYASGIDVLSMPAAMRMEIIGRVSQNTDEMLLFSSVREEIDFPLMNLGLEREERRRRIDRALELFGLERYSSVSTSELSGGEKRRLMLAIIFAVDPRICILDESFDELSPSWRRRLAGIIREHEGTVIAFASHELAEHVGAFDRVVGIGDDGFVPYSPQSLPEVHLRYDRAGGQCLAAKDLVIERIHRSSGDLRDFSLSVPHLEVRGGECCILLGENGSGKSTLSRVLCGLLQEKGGMVSLDGRSLSSKDRRRTVAYLMQNPYEELFLPTVEDEMRSTGASAEAIREALSIFHLDAGEYVQEMSYGRAKLLQAAIFHLLRRPFAIFDEMDSALPYDDFILAASAYLGSGAGLIVITHDERIPSILPGRLMRIEGGRLHEC